MPGRTVGFQQAFPTLHWRRKHELAGHFGVPRNTAAVWHDPATEWTLEHYADGYEHDRLQSGSGLLEVD